MEKYKKGTQVIYIPSHLIAISVDNPIIIIEKDKLYVSYKNGWENTAVENVHFGFVTSINERVLDCVFVRYWTNINATELRTKANSECTPISLLVEHNITSQDKVDKLIKSIEKENKRWVGSNK